MIYSPAVAEELAQQMRVNVMELLWLQGSDWPTLQKSSGWPYWRIREYLEAKFGTALRSEYNAKSY